MFYDNCFWDCIYCIYMCSTWALRFTYLLPFSLWCWDCGFWLLWSHERLPLGDSFTHGVYASLVCWLLFVTHVFSCQSVLFWIMLMGASSLNTSVFILPTVNKKSARVNWNAPHMLPSGKDVVGIVLPEEQHWGQQSVETDWADATLCCKRRILQPLYQLTQTIILWAVITLFFD